MRVRSASGDAEAADDELAVVDGSEPDVEGVVVADHHRPDLPALEGDTDPVGEVEAGELGGEDGDADELVPAHAEIGQAAPRRHGDDAVGVEHEDRDGGGVHHREQSRLGLGAAPLAPHRVGEKGAQPGLAAADGLVHLPAGGEILDVEQVMTDLATLVAMEDGDVDERVDDRAVGAAQPHLGSPARDRWPAHPPRHHEVAAVGGDVVADEAGARAAHHVAQRPVHLDTATRGVDDRHPHRRSVEDAAEALVGVIRQVGQRVRDGAGGAGRARRGFRDHQGRPLAPPVAGGSPVAHGSRSAGSPINAGAGTRVQMHLHPRLAPCDTVSLVGGDPPPSPGSPRRGGARSRP